MAHLPQNSIDHFFHEGHPLKPVDSDKQFLCDGCKTLGTGKRYRCNGCDFDLHDYCRTCPRLLSSFMHPHSLTLVFRRPQQSRQINRICDVCRDPVEGMFFRCKECEFDVHPVCTKLPEKLNHALHSTHPLTLQSSNLVPKFCAVCKNSCQGWQYRCEICNFDIHLGCVLAPVIPCVQHEKISQRGLPLFGQRIPFRPPPQYVSYYGSGYPNFGHYYCPNFGYHGGPYTTPQNYHVGGGSSNNETGQLGKSMFTLVGQLGFGVLSNMIFGVDVPSLFTG
ncbi:hypothetical protein ACS0TY_018400 [Phlomoides rotata]